MVQNVTSIIVAAVTLISFLGSIIIWVSILKSRIDSMAKTTEELRHDLRESTQEARTLIVTVKAFTSTQEVINKFMADQVSQVLHRLDMIENRLNDTLKLRKEERL